LQSAQVWVAGEALIDLLPNGESKLPVVGGGPANTAKALSNLGLSVSFIGGISSDKYGGLIEGELKAYGVNLKLAHRSDLPTALAEVDLSDSGSASYKFKLDNTATFAFGNWLPKGRPDVLHVGTLATIIEPGASALHQWAKELESRILFDPNVRPSVLSNREMYRKHFEKWAEIASVIKLSEEDKKWLGYSIDEILNLGPELVVLTRGAQGLSGFTSGNRIDVEAVEVSVIDTIGAGDTVGAILVEIMLSHNQLEDKDLAAALGRAAKAAAITCTRLGAKPPTRAELDF
jgi:fructokinase